MEVEVRVPRLHRVVGPGDEIDPLLQGLAPLGPFEPLADPEPLELRQDGQQVGMLANTFPIEGREGIDEARQPSVDESPEEDGPHPGMDAELVDRRQVGVRRASRRPSECGRAFRIRRCPGVYG